MSAHHVFLSASTRLDTAMALSQAMTTSRKLWLGFGTLMVLLVLCAVMLVAHWQSLDRFVAEPATTSQDIQFSMRCALLLVAAAGVIAATTGLAVGKSIVAMEARIGENSEELCRQSVEAAGFGAYSYDLDRRTCHWSPELKKIHGLPADAVLSHQRILELIHPNDREHFKQRLAGTFTPPEDMAYEYEFRIVRPDGEERWVCDWGKFEFAGRGRSRKPTRAIGMIVDITERKRGEALQDESDARHRAAFEDSAVGMYQADPITGCLLRVNRRFCKMTGYSHAELANVPFADLLHVEDRGLILEGLARLHRGDISEYRDELRYACKDGGILWGDVTINLVNDLVGLPLRTVAVVKDITERKQAEHKVRVAEQRLRAFLENSAVCGWMKDEEGRYVFLSENHQRRFGVQFENWQGKTDFDLWPRETAEELRHNDLEVLTKGSAVEVLEETLNDSSGRSWWLSRKFPFQDTTGKRYVGGLGVDVTDRIRAEQNLQRIKDTLQAVVENAPSAIVVTDHEGRFLMSNPALEELLGGPLTGDAKGPAGRYTLHRSDGTPFPSEELPLVRALRGQATSDVELMICRGDGTQAVGLAAAAPLRDESGTLWGAIEVMQDITFLKHYEEALWRLNENLELRVEARTEELSRTVSRLEVEIAERERLEREIAKAAELEQRRIGQDLHDSVGQQLTALTMLAQDFVESLQSTRLAPVDESAPADPVTSPQSLSRLAPAELAEHLRRGLQQSLEEVRSISRNLDPVPVDSQGLMAALTDLVESVRPQSKVHCWFDCPLPVVVEDNVTATYLYHIAQEALSNALRHAQARDICIRLEQANSQVVLRIEDDGIGIPRPLPPGTGLGQRTMQNRAAVIGATLTVEPRQPMGTRIQCCVTSRNHEHRSN